jgi:hypothetical protein
MHCISSHRIASRPEGPPPPTPTPPHPTPPPPARPPTLHLQVALPKAEQSAEAQRAAAKDLTQRMAELEVRGSCHPTPRNRMPGALQRHGMHGGTSMRSPFCPSSLPPLPPPRNPLLCRPPLPTHPPSLPPPPLQAATRLSGEASARLAELEATVSRETVALAKLRASTSGLQQKAAGLQVGGGVRGEG